MGEYNDLMTESDYADLINNCIKEKTLLEYFGVESGGKKSNMLRTKKP